MASTTQDDVKATTAAPTSTTLKEEVSSVVPDETKASTTPEPAKQAEPSKTEEHIQPGTEAKPEPEAEPKPEPKAKTPIEELWSLAESHAHDEIWGVVLKDPATDIPSQVVLQKYLNANDGDLVKAKDQLTKTLDWRAKTKPLELLKKQFSEKKFDGVGFVTTHGEKESNDPEQREVFTWNVYGAVKDIEAVFGNLTEFIEWRVSLMELALQSLGIDKATKAITADHDPYKIIQVHDYQSISFFRQPPSVKSASTETIKVFAQNYPELLKEKFFVNVPAIMGFIYTFMKLFVAPKTIKKFHPMRDGKGLAAELGYSTVKDLGAQLPTEYGGKGPGLKEVGSQPATGEASGKAE